MTTDYERGFAAGVEAARVLWVRGEGHKIRALRPSPAPTPTAHSESMKCSGCGEVLRVQLSEESAEFAAMFDGRTLCSSCAAASQGIGRSPSTTERKDEP